MSLHKLTARTYLTLEGTPTTDELEANSLLGNAGDEIPMEQAEALGLAGSGASTSSTGAAAYGDMNVKSLRALVAQREMEVPAKAKKAVLVDALTAYDAAQATVAAAGEQDDQGADPDVDDSGAGE